MQLSNLLDEQQVHTFLKGSAGVIRTNSCFVLFPANDMSLNNPEKPFWINQLIGQYDIEFSFVFTNSA